MPPAVHFLDALSIWGKEFASALGSFVPTIAWVPRLSWTATFQNWECEYDLEDPPLRAKSFPIQRGYRRWPVGRLSRTADRIRTRVLASSTGDCSPILILTSPYYAPVAALWKGPVIYYVTDLLTKYKGFREAQVRQLDREMCRIARVVCPNSTRIANYLSADAECPPAKITVIPNATRKQNLLLRVPSGPAALPSDVADLARPIAGVIGNLAANMDWQLLEQVVVSTPLFSWVFIGPITDWAGSREQERSRTRLVGMGGRVRFAGPKPYGELRDYARAFDVAVLPYRKTEPTYSGSSTRFYEHLAACRPIVSTSGFAELLQKTPLLYLALDAQNMAARLRDLHTVGFCDGFEELRWQTSLGETWESRAALMMQALWGGPSACKPAFETVQAIS